MADPIVIKNYFDMVPDQDNTLNLGAADLRFKKVYAVDFTATGTPTFSNLTEGSVPFIGADGVLSEDNTELFWENVIKQLQIGGTSALQGIESYRVSVSGDREDYVALGVQNMNAGTGASSDITVSADNDGSGLAGHYVDMGITSSTYDPAITGVVKTLAVSAGGYGYAVDDVLSLIAGDSNCSVKVLTLTGDAVETVEILTNGSGYSVASGVGTETTGVGVGCTFNILTLYDNGLTEANDGYLYTSGGALVMGTDDTVANKPIIFHTDGYGVSNERVRITNDGLRLKVQSLAGTPASGNIENDGTHIYYTDSGGTRRQLDQQTGVSEMSPSETLDGAITVFTFTRKPTYVYSDGVKLRENKGWTWNAGTLQITLSVPAQFDLWAE